MGSLSKYGSFKEGNKNLLALSSVQSSLVQCGWSSEDKTMFGQNSWSIEKLQSGSFVYVF